MENSSYVYLDVCYHYQLFNQALVSRFTLCAWNPHFPGWVWGYSALVTVEGHLACLFAPVSLAIGLCIRAVFMLPHPKGLAECLVHAGFSVCAKRVSLGFSLLSLFSTLFSWMSFLPFLDNVLFLTQALLTLYPLPRVFLLWYFLTDFRFCHGLKILPQLSCYASLIFWMW